MDVACYTNSKITGFGMIIRDANGSVVVYATSTMPWIFCSKEAGAIGLR